MLAIHPDTEEVEAGGQKFKIILSDSYSEFEVSLGYNKTLFQKEKKNGLVRPKPQCWEPHGRRGLAPKVVLCPPYVP